jgi:hypothetical protein
MERKKENLFESRECGMSLFSFSVIKIIPIHFHPALIFWFFLIKQKERKLFLLQQYLLTVCF